VTVDELVHLTSETMLLLVLLVLPPVGASLVSGLFVAILQTATQIQEQTVGFAARAGSVIVSLIIAGPWIGRQLHAFSESLFTLIERVQL
jgi:type III secretory pathway component EscS